MRNTGVVTVVLVTVLAASLTAGSSCTSERTGSEIPPAPTLIEAVNTEYHGIYDLPVRLTDGRCEGESFIKGGASRSTVKLIGGIFPTGDLDGDGSDEAAVLLVEDSGGSGSFLYVAVLDRRGGTIENTGTRPVGDRVQVRTLEIEAGKIIMDVIQHGPADALCCPTQKTRRRWMMDGDGMVEEEPSMTGTISTSDLEGIEWILKQLDRKEQYPGDPPITLVFEEGRISGSSGCNRYFSDIAALLPGELEIGETGTTRMTCPDDVMLLENRYLAKIDGAVRYGFNAGRLALTCKIGDRMTTMLFEAVEQDVPEE